MRETVARLGGGGAAVWAGEAGAVLRAVQAEAGEQLSLLQLQQQLACTSLDKVEDLVVTEHSSVRDLK